MAASIHFSVGKGKVTRQAHGRNTSLTQVPVSSMKSNACKVQPAMLYITLGCDFFGRNATLGSATAQQQETTAISRARSRPA
jgi:hypothetical protein